VILFKNDLITQLGAFTSVAAGVQGGTFQLALYGDNGSTSAPAPGARITNTDTMTALGGNDVCTNNQAVMSPPQSSSLISGNAYYWIVLLVTGSTPVNIVGLKSGGTVAIRCGSSVQAWPDLNPTTSSDCASSEIIGTSNGLIPYVFALVGS